MRSEPVADLEQHSSDVMRFTNTCWPAAAASARTTHRVGSVRRGELDADQIRIIDRVGRRVSEAATLAAIDEQAVEAAQTRSPKQLQVWLLRLVVQLEPSAFEQRHRRALAERRVTIVQGADGMGYVTGEVSAADAAAIDAMLAATARNLGAADPRTDQQRRADLFADLLLGRIAFDQSDGDDDEQSNANHADGNDAGGRDADGQDHTEAETGQADWLEVEDIDPDTGELLGTRLQRIDADGHPVGEPVDVATHLPSGRPATPRFTKRPRTHRIGIVVPLASLLGASDKPAELRRPFCRRHHRAKTFAWLACVRDDHGVDWTMPDAEHYRCLDDPLPTGRAA